jgi:hypothetical protein
VTCASYVISGCLRYGRDNTFREMVDVQFVAAMGPPGGGRAFITNRLLRHFNVLACAQVNCIADNQPLLRRTPKGNSLCTVCKKRSLMHVPLARVEC